VAEDVLDRHVAEDVVERALVDGETRVASHGDGAEDLARRGVDVEGDAIGRLGVLGGRAGLGDGVRNPLDIAVEVADDGLRVARDLGYPVILKAAKGGGARAAAD